MPENVLQYILRNPMGCKGFEPEGEGQSVDHQPGSRAKMDVLAKRVLAGEPLWHDEDRDSRDEWSE